MILVTRSVNNFLNGILYCFDFVLGRFRVRDLSDGKSFSQSQSRFNNARNRKIWAVIPNLDGDLRRLRLSNCGQKLGQVLPGTSKNRRYPVREQLRKEFT